MAPLTRYLGAAALLAVGLDHLDQWSAAHYADIPTIGTLFLLNAVSAAVVAIALALPLQRLGGPAGRRLPALLALGGAGIAAGSIAGLLVSETSGLFGFKEDGYRGAIVLSIALEAATVLLLGAYAASALRAATGGGRRTRTRTDAAPASAVRTSPR
jgi:hypothetical protein